MARSPRQLALSVVALAAFLAAGTGDLLVRHPCPHHDALPGQHVAGQGDHGDHAASPEAPAEGAGHSGGACTCLGQCAAANDAPAAPTARLASPRAPDSSPHAAPRVPTADPLRSPVAHRLHQPNAPPLSA